MSFLDFNPYPDENNANKPVAAARYFETFCRKLWLFLTCNALVIVFSLPVFTIGPSAVALCRIICDVLRERSVSVSSDFYRYFKSNFKQGLFISFCVLPVLVLLFYLIITCIQKAGAGSILPVCILGVALVFAMSFSGYCCILTGHMKLPIWQLIKNSAILTFAGKQYSIIGSLLSIALLSLHFIFLPASLPLILLIGVSFSAYSFCYFGWKTIDKYIFIPYYKSHTQEGMEQGYIFDADGNLL